MNHAELFLINQTHLDESDIDDNEEHNFSATDLVQLLSSYVQPFREQNKDLKTYIVDTHESGVDKETLESRAEQYKEELKHS